MRTPPAAISANIACFFSMFVWALAFPISEIMLESWGVVALAAIRTTIGAIALLLLWTLIDGWQQVRTAQWVKGIWIGGIGFGVGSILFLLGQKWSTAVTPAITAAMMPIIAATLEVLLDGRKLTTKLLLGIVLAIVGGLTAAGASITDSSFGLGALLCLAAVIMFAWSTKLITQGFTTISILGKTTITLIGASVVLLLSLVLTWFLSMDTAKIGVLDQTHISLLLVSSLLSLAFSQTLWIWSASGLGILLASFHMNAVPFYVMVIMTLFLNDQWHWLQALGGLLVAVGVLVAQFSSSQPEHST